MERGPGSRNAPDGRARWAIGLGLLLYAAGVALASYPPGPRAWGLHAVGFLPATAQFVVWIGLLGGILLVLPGAARGPSPKGADSPGALNPENRWHLVGFLCAWAFLLWVFRVRTHFLGDGALWLSGLSAGERIESNEPLAEALWLAAARVLRLAHIEPTAGTIAPVSVACGVLAGILFWNIAREIARGRGPFVFPLLLLLTMGTSQLFFGYVESYPPVAVAILWFLLAGIRCARMESGTWTPAIALSVAIAAHLACLFLLPGYVYLVLGARGAVMGKVLRLALPVALGVTLLLLVGFGPERWAETLRVASLGMGAQPVVSPRDARPYTLLSLDHAVDLGNEILLVIPTLFVLLCSGFALGYGREIQGDRRLRFLAVTSASGFLAASLLVLQVAPAQDWDLFALFLMPAGVLGAWMAPSLVRMGGRGFVRRGVSLFALAAFAAFVFLNAGTVSGLRRYETLLGPGARITMFGQTYGYELLAYYHRHSGSPEMALRYADALLRREPTNHRLWAMAGTIRMSRGDHAGAIADFEEAIRRGRNTGGTWANLGICYTYEGNYAAALERFRRAVAAEPDRPEWRLDLAFSLLSTSHPDSARVVLTETAARWPRYAPARRALARFFPERPRMQKNQGRGNETPAAR